MSGHRPSAVVVFVGALFGAIASDLWRSVMERGIIPLPRNWGELGFTLGKLMWFAFSLGFVVFVVFGAKRASDVILSGKSWQMAYVRLKFRIRRLRVRLGPRI